MRKGKKCNKGFNLFYCFQFPPNFASSKQVGIKSGQDKAQLFKYKQYADILFNKSLNCCYVYIHYALGEPAPTLITW
jgi:hypothetical protein